MSAAVSLSGTARIASAEEAPSGPPRGGESRSLLPAPTTKLEAGIGDAMSAMYALMSMRRNENASAGATKVEANKNERGRKLEEEKVAIQHQKEAAGD